MSICRWIRAPLWWMPLERVLSQTGTEQQSEEQGRPWVDDVATFVCDPRPERVPSKVAAVAKTRARPWRLGLHMNLVESKTETVASRSVCSF